MADIRVPAATPATHLAQLQRRYEAAKGDERLATLLLALMACGHFKIPPPKWLAEAFSNAASAWLELRAVSLDAAFGASRRTAKRLALQRRRLALRDKIGAAVRMKRRAGEPVRARDWEELERSIGASKTALQDVFYARAADVLFSRTRKKPRKRGRPRTE